LEHSPVPRTISKKYALEIARHLFPLSLLIRAAMAISIFQLVMGFFAGVVLIFPLVALIMAFVLEWAALDLLKRAGITNAKVEGHEEA
jgi:hypothetical protein